MPFLSRRWQGAVTLALKKIAELLGSITMRDLCRLLQPAFALQIVQTLPTGGSAHGGSSPLSTLHSVPELAVLLDHCIRTGAAAKKPAGRVVRMLIKRVARRPDAADVALASAVIESYVAMVMIRPGTLAISRPKIKYSSRLGAAARCSLLTVSDPSAGQVPERR